MQLSITTSLLLILCLAFVLVKAATLTTAAIHSIAKLAKIRMFGLAAMLVAISTSFPELFITVSAAASGQTGLSVGTIMGSNISNISLILGLAALGAGSIKAINSFVMTEIFYVFLIGSLPALLLVDGSLSRLDSLGLLAGYVGYLAVSLSKRPAPKAQSKLHDHWRRTLTTITSKRFEHALLLGVIGLVGMVLAAQTMVRLAEHLALLAGIPVFMIGLFVVAIGSSLPELVFELLAIRHHENQLAFGNIFGSVAANSTLILGLTGLITPITLEQNIRPYLLSVIGFIGLFGLFWWLVRTKHRLDRWEGGLLVAAYLLFITMQYLWR